MILSAALFATRVVPRAIPASILVSLVINFVGLEMLSRLFFLIGLGWLGVVVLVRGDDAWVAAETDGGRP